MGKIVLILLCLSSLSAQAQTHSYIPLLDSTARWVGVNSINDGMNIYISPYEEYIQGDSIIRGQSYRKLYASSTVGGAGSLFCYLREDTMGRVYFIGSRPDVTGAIVSDSSEHLLYDFSLSVGQGINDTVIPYQPQILYVDTINTISGTRRRLFTTHNAVFLQNDHFWVEGVGGTQILQNDFVDCFETCWCLSTKSVNGQLVYQDTLTCPFYTTGISNVPLLNVSLYPIPANGILTVDMRQNTTTITKTYATLNLYNSLGQRLRAVPRDNSGLVEINVSDLSEGVYLLTIKDINGTEIMLPKFNVTK